MTLSLGGVAWGILHLLQSGPVIGIYVLNVGSSLLGEAVVSLVAWLGVFCLNLVDKVDLHLLQVHEFEHELTGSLLSKSWLDEFIHDLGNFSLDVVDSLSH